MTNKKTTQFNLLLSAVVTLCFSTAIMAADMGGIIKAQILLGKVTQLMDKYQDVQALIDAGTIELEVPEPAEGNTGEFLFPYDENGYLTAWAEKALNAQVGAQAGGLVADQAINSVASRIPLGGFLAGSARGKAKETGAVIAIGGWDFIRETSDTSFNKLEDLSVYMHVQFVGDSDYEQALASAMAIYPKLEQGHQRAVDNAFKEARKQARKLN